MSQVIIRNYQPIPDEQVVSLDMWKDVVDGAPSQHGVVWIYHKCTERRVSVSDSEPPRKRGRPAKKLWSFFYYCHRHGKKKSNNQRGGITGKTRPIQKASKRIDCKAHLTVTCFVESPDEVHIVHKGPHCHNVGSLEDLQHLPLSESMKTEILQRLQEGYRQRDIRVAMQRYFNDQENEIFHRDQVVHSEDIYNLYRKVQERAFKKDNDQGQSVFLWLRALRDQGFSIHIPNDFTTSFTFGFCSSWQRSLLTAATSVCLDATHNTTTISHGILYTIVTRHPETGAGCPVAYLYTTDQTAPPLLQWLQFLKDTAELSSLSKITIDCSYVEEFAIRGIFPNVSIQWCLFHVARAWMDQIRKRIKLGSASRNNEVHKQIISSLKLMMWERSRSAFTEKLRAFYGDFGMYTDFIAYFKKQYLINDAFMEWSAAYQPQIFTNMETNNYVESWHNQLKPTYLQSGIENHVEDGQGDERFCNLNSRDLTASTPRIAQKKVCFSKRNASISSLTDFHLLSSPSFMATAKARKPQLPSAIRL